MYQQLYFDLVNADESKQTSMPSCVVAKDGAKTPSIKTIL
jgi:hypothetical protein